MLAESGNPVLRIFGPRKLFRIYSDILKPDYPNRPKQYTHVRASPRTCRSTSAPLDRKIVPAVPVPNYSHTVVVPPTVPVGTTQRFLAGCTAGTDRPVLLVPSYPEDWYLWYIVRAQADRIPGIPAGMNSDPLLAGSLRLLLGSHTDRSDRPRVRTGSADDQNIRSRSTGRLELCFSSQQQGGDTIRSIHNHQCNHNNGMRHARH